MFVCLQMLHRCNFKSISFKRCNIFTVVRKKSTWSLFAIVSILNSRKTSLPSFRPAYNKVKSIHHGVLGIACLTLQKPSPTISIQSHFHQPTYPTETSIKWRVAHQVVRYIPSWDSFFAVTIINCLKKGPVL